MLDQEEYRESDGAICPVCQAAHVCYARAQGRRERPDLCGDELRVYVRCGLCGATWTDVYELARYVDVLVPPVDT